MGKQQNDLNKLYSSVSGQFDIGDFDSFKARMTTPDDRRKFYDKVSAEGFDLGDYNEYESRLGKLTEVSPQGSVDTSVELAQPGQNTAQQGLPIPQPNGESLSQSWVSNLNQNPVESVEDVTGVAIDTSRETPLTPEVEVAGTFREGWGGNWNYDLDGYENYTVSPEVFNDVFAGDVDRAKKYFEEKMPNTLVHLPMSEDVESGVGVIGGNENVINNSTAKPTDLGALQRERELSNIDFNQLSETDQSAYLLQHAYDRMKEYNKSRGWVDKDALAQEAVTAESERKGAKQKTEDLEAGWLDKYLLDPAGNAFEGFGRGSTALLKNTLGIPEFAGNALISAYNGVLSAVENESGVDLDSWKGTNVEDITGQTVLDDFKGYLQGTIDRSKSYLESRYNDKGLYDNLKEGNYNTFTNKLADNIGEMLPFTLMLIGSGGTTSGSAPGFALGTTSVASGKYDEIRNNPNVPDNIKFLNALVSGVAETGTELVGNKFLLEPLEALIKQGGKELATKTLATTLRKAMGKMYPVAGSAIEVSTEVASTVIDNVNDIVTGVDKDRKISEGVEDTIIAALAMSGAVQTPVTIANTIHDKSNRNKALKLSQSNAEIEVALNDKEIPQEVRLSLEAKYKQNLDALNAYIEQEQEAKGNLNPTQRAIVDNLEARKKRLEPILTSEAVPETVVEETQVEVDEINDEINEIITTKEPDLSSKTPEEIDANVETIRKATPLMADARMGDLEVQDSSFEILDKIASNEAITDAERSGAIEDLYNKKKELKQLLSNPERVHTQEEINTAIEGIDSDLESLNEYSQSSPSIYAADLSVVKPGDKYSYDTESGLMEGEVKSSALNDDGSITVVMNDGTEIKSETNENIEISRETDMELPVAPVQGEVAQTEELVEETPEATEVVSETEILETPTETITQRSSFANEDEYYRNVAETSTNPDEIASEYHKIAPREPDFVESKIMDYLGNSKINDSDYARYGDRNNLDGAKKRRWIDSKNSSISLDTMAQELSDQLGFEVTPNEIVDFIDRYGSRKDIAKSLKTDGQRALEDKYFELTGKKLTPSVAERASRKVDRQLTDRKLAEANEGLQELGITYEDILRYEEFNEAIARSDSGGLQQPQNNQGGSARNRRKGTRAQEKPKVNEAKKDTTQKNEPATVQPEAVEESSAPVDTGAEAIRSSYQRLTEGMTPEQIEADPDLVRMRDRITPQSPVEAVQPQPPKDTKKPDIKGKPLYEIAKSSRARAERLGELRERIAKHRESRSGLGISPNSKREAEHWRDVTDFAILSLIDGVVNNSRQLADALGLPHNKKLIEAWSKAKNELFDNKEEYGDVGLTAAKNSENARRRKEYGFDERITPVVQGFNQVEQEADRLISEGYDVNSLIDRALMSQPLNAVEVVILTKYSQQVEARLIDANESIENEPNTHVAVMQEYVRKRDKAIDDMYRVIAALETSGTVAARALNIRKSLLAYDVSLAGMFTEYRKAVGNRELTDTEIKNIQDGYKRAIELKNQIEQRNIELEKENIRLDAELELSRQKYEAELEHRKNRNKNAARTEQIKDIQERRTAAKENLSKALKGFFSTNSGLALDPKEEAKRQVEADKSIAKALRELVRTYIDEALVKVGRVDFDKIIDRIYEDVKESVPNVTRDQVMNLIDSANPDSRPTKNDLQREVQKFTSELKMLNEINRLENGGRYIKRSRTDVQDARLKYLRAQLNHLRKANNDTPVETKSDNQKAIDSLNKRIDETKKKIDNKEFSPERKQLQLTDPQVKKLQKELKEHQFRFKVEARKEEYKRRNWAWKVSGAVREVFAVPRTVMATGDLSAPLRQTAFVFASRPLQIIPALGKMFQFYASKDNYEAYFDDFKNTLQFDLMQRAGVSMTDLSPNIGAAAREEQFMSAFVANIEKYVPGIGGGEVEFKGKKINVPGLQLHSRAERGFTGFINKVRIDLFTHGSELLMREGKFPDTHLDDYKKLGTYINAVSGRGPMPESWSGVMADLSSVFFAPRLMTSRLYLIAGGPLYNTNKTVRQMYLRDLTSFIAFGTLVMATASLAGADVVGDEDDEILLGQGAAESWTNSDFGNIVTGETRYSVWGGFEQYVRFFSRMAFGQKTSTTGKVTRYNTEEWNSETYADAILRFGRSKLSPTASLVASALVGKNYMGEPFSLQQELLNMASPLVWQDTYESWVDADEGAKSLYTTFLPSFFGMGVQRWEMNSFLNKGVDDKLGDMLADKKVATLSVDINRVKIYDVKTGENKQPTANQFRKYSDIWAEYVKSDLSDNYEKYKKMSSDDFDKKFTAIKSAATRYAKQQMTGVSNEDLVIEFDSNTYKLTPEQVQMRIEMKNRYIKEYRSDYRDLEKDYIQEGMDPAKAKIEAEKKMDRDARSASKFELIDMMESGRIKLQEK